MLSSVIYGHDQLHKVVDLPSEVELIEVRGDLWHPSEACLQRLDQFSLLYSLKSISEGGNFDGPLTLRHRRLIEASPDYDLIELEGERDLTPEVLQAIPADKRLISWQGTPETVEELASRLDKYQRTPARYYRLQLDAASTGDAVPALALLHRCQRSDLITYGIGPQAIWTQILAAFYGSPIMPSLIDANEQSDYLDAASLVTDFGLPNIYPVKHIFGIAGAKTLKRASLRLHNSAYRNLNLPYLYLPFQADSLHELFDSVINNPLMNPAISGLTVVAPFKYQAFDLATSYGGTDVIESACSNLMVNKLGWLALSTDAPGCLDALNEVDPDWINKKIALVGFGGAGKSVAVTLGSKGVDLTLVNRSVATASRFAVEHDLPFIPLADFDPAPYDIIIHTTPLAKNQWNNLFDFNRLNKDCAVIEYVYLPDKATSLIEYCRKNNLRCVDGERVAELQTRYQFKFMTGLDINSTAVVSRQEIRGCKQMKECSA
ncbi:type I 3-dehydroquinate dehydratase [Spongorhabdus nitratireducens]